MQAAMSWHMVANCCSVAILSSLAFQVQWPGSHKRDRNRQQQALDVMMKWTEHILDLNGQLIAGSAKLVRESHRPEGETARQQHQDLLGAHICARETLPQLAGERT